MTKHTHAAVLLAMAATALSGCGAVKTIFKGGMWIGVIVALLVVGVFAIGAKALKR